MRLPWRVNGQAGDNGGWANSGGVVVERALAAHFQFDSAAILLNRLYGISKNQATPSWCLCSNPS